MRLEGRVPTVAEATQYFQDMAAGKLPKRQSGQGRSRRLFGSWYNSAQGQVQPPTTLVTPVAMDVEQAKSKLRQAGQSTGRKKKNSASISTKRPARPRKKKPSGQQGGSRKKYTSPKKRQSAVRAWRKRTL